MKIMNNEIINEDYLRCLFKSWGAFKYYVTLKGGGGSSIALGFIVKTYENP